MTCRVLIAAVNKATTNLELHFFNNCFNDDYTDCKLAYLPYALSSMYYYSCYNKGYIKVACGFDDRGQ